MRKQVEKLKDENHSLMEELVAKKMALAELSENHARLKRDLHRRAERDKARDPDFNPNPNPNHLSTWRRACMALASTWSQHADMASVHSFGCMVPAYDWPVPCPHWRQRPCRRIPVAHLHLSSMLAEPPS